MKQPIYINVDQSMGIKNLSDFCRLNALRVELDRNRVHKSKEFIVVRD